MEDAYKEIYFDKYCKTCKYSDVEETEDPCCECLDEPARVCTHKPSMWEEDPNKKEKTNDEKKI